MSFSSVTTVLLELHVPDFQKVKEYYGNLGFDVVWERKPEQLKGYLVMKMEDNILCFWAGNEFVYQQPFFKKFSKNTTRGYGVEITIIVSDIKTYYQKIKDTTHVVEPLIRQPWGLWDFRAVDPFGYYLRFTTPFNVLNDKFAIP